MTVQTKIITKRLFLGEGPHWDEKAQALYFVDISDCSIHKYDPKTGSHTQAKIPEADGSVSLVIPVKDTTNKFLITSGMSIATVLWDGVSEKVSDFKVLHTLDAGSNKRINDGKASPSGVLYAGTMTQNFNLDNWNIPKGSFYSFKNLKSKKLLDGICISNGLTWSLDKTLLYYIDTGKLSVHSYKCDKETTELSDEKVVFDFKENSPGAYPDGMTIDTDGNLWIACYSGSKVINVDPRTGQILRTVELPARFITSVAFGGPNYEDLYVTSAEGEIPNPTPKPEDGCTFVVTGLGARGLPADTIQL